jgi:hypothetical protein
LHNIKNARMAQSKLRSSGSKDEKRLSLLEKTGIIAQIFLSFVAIFGYFYTVRPVYQKEQLAEQVAEYDSIIKRQTPLIKEIGGQLSALQEERVRLSSQLTRERSELQTERARLTGELRAIERQLVLAQEEKKRVEAITEFMTFRYQLPDGRPATTREEVKTAQGFEAKRYLLSNVSLNCTYGVSSSPFSRYSASRANEKDASWPFTLQEMSVWREHGAKYPSKKVADCIESALAEAAKSQRASSEAVEEVRREFIQHLEREASLKAWTPPLQPQDLIDQLASRRAQIEKRIETARCGPIERFF